jgi:type VI secretion system secreted protein VgrG
VASAVIEIHCDGALPETQELLHRDCVLSIERDAQSRSFRGVVQHAEVRQAAEGAVLTLRAAPAMAYLEHIVDTRIYQDMTVLDVIQDLFEEKLGDRARRVRNECGTHDVHEYLVQYNESCLAFAQRLLEREGIFYYFDHGGDHETLVLADAVSSCLPVRGGAEIPFSAQADQALDHEAIASVHSAERSGSISHGQPELPLEPGTHRQVVTHDHRDGRYRARSAEGQAKMTGTVVSAQPGRTFTLSGAPEPSFDGRYLILQSRTVAVAVEGAKGFLTQDMVVHPTGRPYVPPCKTPVPIIHGMELATVVGPDGAEVHTDEHGRIKVQFPWDRQGRNDRGSSCWIRVAQMWGGILWGTHFTPRVGTEVIVSFLCGHPDRPVMIGSLYNGAHRPPYAPQGRTAQVS